MLEGKHRALRARLYVTSFTFLSISSLLVSSVSAEARSNAQMIQELHPSQVEHVDQNALIERAANDPKGAFLEAFDLGDELFEVEFLYHDGGGAKVGNGQRTTRVPRADLEAWRSHTPARSTGPNGFSCIECHNRPVADGAGSASLNVHRDPFHTGDLAKMIQRNTPHLHGMGALQRLAEEMTEALQDIMYEAGNAAYASQQSVTRQLSAKGIEFGQITAIPSPYDVQFDTRYVKGVDADLVVKPFQWKGNFATIRDFNNDAMHNELGVQPVELVGDDVDGDFDGVTNEATVGDITALTLYLAAQPRPTTRTELAKYGLGPEVTPEEQTQIAQGEQIFEQVGCASCHTPSFTINYPVYAEPSFNHNYREALFPAGQNRIARGLDPRRPLVFDLTADQPDNQVFDEYGNLIAHLGALETDGTDAAIIRPYGDLKRHRMGPALAESIDEAGTGSDVFLTENLWGVGVTAPYLHDGRATTLTEAILWHGGDSAQSRRQFQQLPPADQAALIAFLNNLVIYLPDEEEE